MPFFLVPAGGLWFYFTLGALRGCLKSRQLPGLLPLYGQEPCWFQAYLGSQEPWDASQLRVVLVAPLSLLLPKDQDPGVLLRTLLILLSSPLTWKNGYYAFTLSSALWFMSQVLDIWSQHPDFFFLKAGCGFFLLKHLSFSGEIHGFQHHGFCCRFTKVCLRTLSQYFDSQFLSPPFPEGNLTGFLSAARKVGKRGTRTWI